MLWREVFNQNTILVWRELCPAAAATCVFAGEIVGERVSVPASEFVVGSARRKTQDKPAVFDGNFERSEVLIRVFACVSSERFGGRGTLRSRHPGIVRGCILRLCNHLRKELAGHREIVVLRLAIMHQVEEVEADRLRQTDGHAIAQGKHAEVFFGNHIDAGSRPEEKCAAMADLRMALGIGLYVPAEAVVLAAGAVVGFCRVWRQPADLGLVGLRKRVRSDDLLAVPLALIKLQPDPFSEIAGAGTDATGRRFGVGLAHEGVNRLAVDENVQRSFVSTVFVIGETRTGGRHAKPGIKLLAGNHLPRLADLCGGGDCPGGVAEVAVGVCLAEPAGQRQISHAVQDLRARVAEVFEQVAGFGGEAAAMREKLADRDLAGCLGIGKLEAGVEIGDAVVPTDLSLADERGEDGRGDGLRERRDFKHGVGIDLRGFSYFANAVAPEKHDLVVIHDRDRYSGDFSPAKAGADVRFELRKRRLDAFWRDVRLLLRRAGESEPGKERKAGPRPGALPLSQQSNQFSALIENLCARHLSRITTSSATKRLQMVPSILENPGFLEAAREPLLPEP